MPSNTLYGTDAGAALTTGENITAIGANALASATTLSNSVAVGWSAMEDGSPADSVGVGMQALELATGAEQVAVGHRALCLTTTGERNTAVGHLAGALVTTGSRNTFLGESAGNIPGQLASVNDSIVIGRFVGSTANGQIVIGGTSQNQLHLFGQRYITNYPSQNSYFVGPLTGNMTLTGSGNIGLGYDCLTALTTGGSMTAVGFQTLRNQTVGGSVTAVGFRAFMKSTAVQDCVAVGSHAFEECIDGVGGVAIGHFALRNALTAGNNVGVGDSALYKLTTGIQNVVVGYVAAHETTTGSENTVVGHGALLNTTTANGNTVIGHQSMFYTSGEKNVTLGWRTGYALTSGDGNVFIGADAGYNNGSGQANGVSNSIAIGQSAVTTASNQVVLGNTNITQTVLRGAIQYGAGPAILMSPSAGVHQLGAADAAIPVAQTIRVQSVAAGTSNTAGADLTIQGSRSTGTAAGGSIIFQVTPEGSSGTTQNAYSTALRLARTRDAIFGAHIYVPNNSCYFWVGRSGLSSPADGQLTLRNNANTDGATWSLGTGILHLNRALVFAPGSSVTPTGNGDVTFELTNNTTLTVKAKGSDGIVRSGTIALSGAEFDLQADSSQRERGHGEDRHRDARAARDSRPAGARAGLTPGDPISRIALPLNDPQEADALLHLLDLASKTGGIANNVAGNAQEFARRVLAAKGGAEHDRSAEIASGQKGAVLAEGPLGGDGAR